MNGEPHIYNGNTYPVRTYDINHNITKKDGWQTGYVTFYAVPDGCTEYAIACGDTKDKSYYRIKSDKYYENSENN